MVVVVGAPVQGTVTGRQGAAGGGPTAVAGAAATAGFAGEVHMPHGGMLPARLASVIVAAGRPSITTLAIGRTLRTDGASPMLHCRAAVATAAGLPMSLVPLVVRAGERSS